MAWAKISSRLKTKRVVQNCLSYRM